MKPHKYNFVTIPCCFEALAVGKQKNRNKTSGTFIYSFLLLSSELAQNFPVKTRNRKCCVMFRYIITCRQKHIFQLQRTSIHLIQSRKVLNLLAYSVNTLAPTGQGLRPSILPLQGISLFWQKQ